MVDNAIIEGLLNFSELSYNDYADEYIELLHNGKFVANVEIFTDEDDDKEYIYVNDEVVYLNTLFKHN